MPLRRLDQVPGTEFEALSTSTQLTLLGERHSYSYFIGAETKVQRD